MWKKICLWIAFSVNHFQFITIVRLSFCIADNKFSSKNILHVCWSGNTVAHHCCNFIITIYLGIVFSMICLLRNIFCKKILWYLLWPYSWKRAKKIGEATSCMSFRTTKYWIVSSVVYKFYSLEYNYVLIQKVN